MTTATPRPVPGPPRPAPPPAPRTDARSGRRRHGRIEEPDHRRAVARPLARGGRRRGRLRHPRRRDPARLRPAARLHEGPARPGPPRAGRRARGDRLRAGHRQGRGLHGDLRARARPTWSPRSPTRTWTRCRSSRSPARSAAAADRHRRLPGGRHPRHHACRSPSTTSWSPTPTEIPRAIAEAFHLAATGRPGPGAGRHPQGRAAGADRPSPGRRTLDLPGYRPTTRPHGKQIREAARLIAAARRPVLYVGGGVLKAGATAELRRAGRADRHPGGHHADGPRRLPGQPPAAPGHARHARHGRRGRPRCRRPTCSSRSAPGSTTGSPASCRRFAPGRARSSTPTSTRPRSARTGAADVPIVGDAKRGDRPS